MLNTNVLLYFVRYPEPGRVKTRLARSIGVWEAARRYQELAEENFKVLLSLKGKVSVAVAFDPPDEEAKIRSWLPDADLYFPQHGGGLGERLAEAFRWAFDVEAKKVLALGSDTLGLRPEIVEEASEALDDSELVLGPARDGGYYLVGLTRRRPDLFENIPWSTSSVLDATLVRAEELGLSCALSRLLEDLDGIENDVCRHSESPALRAGRDEESEILRRPSGAPQDDCGPLAHLPAKQAMTDREGGSL